LKTPSDDFSEDARNSEIPVKFAPKTDSFDYVRREEMIPMRDGVKLKTIILVPKGAQDAPIVITRTPYNAAGRTLRFNSPNLSMVWSRNAVKVRATSGLPASWASAHASVGLLGVGVPVIIHNRACELLFIQARSRLNLAVEGLR